MWNLEVEENKLMSAEREGGRERRGVDGYSREKITVKSRIYNTPFCTRNDQDKTGPRHAVIRAWTSLDEYRHNHRHRHRAKQSRGPDQPPGGSR